jgi:hypothetical protein
VAHEEGSAPGVPVRERVVEALVMVGAVGADVTPCIDGDRVNEVEPQPTDTPSAADLVLRSLRGSGFSPPREAASDDMMSIAASFDVVDPGTGELGLSGCPWASSPLAS